MEMELEDSTFAIINQMDVDQKVEVLGGAQILVDGIPCEFLDDAEIIDVNDLCHIREPDTDTDICLLPSSAFLTGVEEDIGIAANPLLNSVQLREDIDKDMLILDGANIVHQVRAFDAGSMKLIDSQEVMLDDGTTAFIQSSDTRSEYITLIPSTDGFVQLNNVTAPKQKKKTDLGKGSKQQRVHACAEPNCDRVYTTPHHLRVHMRSHTGDKPYKCTFELCCKAFSTAYALKAHTRVHTNDRPYKCLTSPKTCTKAFKTCGDLQKHVRTHTGERPFHCPFEGCNRSFTTSNIKKVHIRTHTGERPFICGFDDCTKAFASVTNFTNHIRIHTGEKPYQCKVEQCGKRFTEYSSLHKHNSLHTGLKPFLCKNCGKTYRQMNTLTNHKKNNHNDFSPVTESDRISDAEYERRNLLKNNRRNPEYIADPMQNTELYNSLLNNANIESNQPVYVLMDSIN